MQRSSDYQKRTEKNQSPYLWWWALSIEQFKLIPLFGCSGHSFVWPAALSLHLIIKLFNGCKYNRNNRDVVLMASVFVHGFKWFCMHTSFNIQNMTMTVNAAGFLFFCPFILFIFRDNYNDQHFDEKTIDIQRNYFQSLNSFNDDEFWFEMTVSKLFVAKFYRLDAVFLFLYCGKKNNYKNMINRFWL